MAWDRKERRKRNLTWDRKERRKRDLAWDRKERRKRDLAWDRKERRRRKEQKGRRKRWGGIMRSLFPIIPRKYFIGFSNLSNQMRGLV